MKYETTIMQWHKPMDQTDRDHLAEISFESDFNGDFLHIETSSFELVFRDNQIIELGNFIKANIESQKGVLL